MLTFDPVPHIYKFNGDIKSSVTTIINEFVKVRIDGYFWYIHTTKRTAVPADIFEAAGDHGTAAHLCFKLVMDGTGVNVDGLHPDLLPVLGEIEKFKAEHVQETIMCEVPLYSKKFDYCGTPDWFGRLKGWKYPVIIDLKTGQHELVAVQLAAYEQPIREATGYKGIIKHLCLSIPKRGETRLFEVTDRQAFKEFRNRHEVFKRNAGRAA